MCPAGYLPGPMVIDKNPNDVFPQRLFALDALRGVACLAVVFWHWQHFFYVGSDPAGFIAAQQPFYGSLRVFYDHGALGVPIFFALSGFVLFWLYSDGLAAGNVSVRRFAADRFSRLYPLHLATMLIVLVLQEVYWSGHDRYFIYPFNDAYHGLLNLALIPAWGFEKGWSFNAPIWSVSVEVLLYLVFALCCLLGRVRLAACALLLGLGIVLPEQHYKVATGLRMFFAGGFAWLATRMMIERLGKFPAAFVLGATASLLWLSAPFVDVGSMAFEVAFPVTVAALAAVNTVIPGLFRRGAWLGEISYSVYLLHFPLQIVFVLVVDGLGFQRDIFRQEWMLIVFVTVLLASSHFCYRMLELPMKHWIRTTFRTYRGFGPVQL